MLSKYVSSNNGAYVAHCVCRHLTDAAFSIMVKTEITINVSFGLNIKHVAMKIRSTLKKCEKAVMEN